MKYTMQEAMKILGITKDTTKDEIEKKYDIVLKKYRIRKSEGTLDEQAESDFQNSTEAYRIVMGYEVDEPKIPKKETYSDKAFKKAGIDPKKANNFFYYHKVHIVISIIALIVIIMTVRSIVLRVDPDVTVGLLGEVYQPATEILETKIYEKIPEITKVAFDSATLTDNYEDPQAYAYMQKAMVLIAASDIKLFIVNKFAYERYALDGAFMALEDIAKDLNIDISDSEYLKLRVVDDWEETTDPNAVRKPKTYIDNEPRLYGIDVTDSELFKDADVVGPEKILVVRAGSEDIEFELKLIELFAK